MNQEDLSDEKERIRKEAQLCSKTLRGDNNIMLVGDWQQLATVLTQDCRRGYI